MWPVCWWNKVVKVIHICFSCSMLCMDGLLLHLVGKRQLLVYLGAPYGNGKLGDSIGESHHKNSTQGACKANIPPSGACFFSVFQVGISPDGLVFRDGGYFENIHGAENFSSRPRATTFSSDVRLFFTQARGRLFQPCCGPVFKTRANSGPCGMLRPFFFQAAQGPPLSALLWACVNNKYRSRARSGPCGMFRPQTVFLKDVLASCVVPV